MLQTKSIKFTCMQLGELSGSTQHLSMSIVTLEEKIVNVNVIKPTAVC